MIEAHDLLAKMGKKKFHDFVVNGQRGQKTMHELSRGIKGRVRFRMCEHANWIIENYEFKRCPKCRPISRTKSKDFVPHFNMGLGAYVETKSEMLSLAKSKGMIHIGDDKQ